MWCHTDPSEAEVVKFYNFSVLIEAPGQMGIGVKIEKKNSLLLFQHVAYVGGFRHEWFVSLQSFFLLLFYIPDCRDIRFSPKK